MIICYLSRLCVFFRSFIKTRSQIANLGSIWKVYFQSRRGYTFATPPLAVCETNLTQHVHYLGGKKNKPVYNITVLLKHSFCLVFIKSARLACLCWFAVATIAWEHVRLVCRLRKHTSWRISKICQNRCVLPRWVMELGEIWHVWGKGLLKISAQFSPLGKLEPIPNAQMCLCFENSLSCSAWFSDSQCFLAFRFTLQKVTFTVETL